VRRPAKRNRKQVRDAVLRRRAAADAFAKAEEVARMLTKYAEVFGTKLVKKWVKRQYGAQSSERLE